MSLLEISDQEVRQLLFFCSINLEVHDEDLRSNELQIENTVVEIAYCLVILVLYHAVVLSEYVNTHRKIVIASQVYQVLF